MWIMIYKTIINNWIDKTIIIYNNWEKYIEWNLYKSNLNSPRIDRYIYNIWRVILLYLLSFVKLLVT